MALDDWALARNGRSEWLNRDPIGEKGGPNLYGFVRGNPVGYFDPLGKSAGITDGKAPEGAHTGIQVDLRDASGEIVGCLKADYHAYGFMNDGGKGGSSSGATGDLIDSLSARGRLTLTVCPTGKCKPPTRSIAGTAEQDAGLVDYILGTASGASDWFRNAKSQLNHCGQPPCNYQNFDGVNGWETYRTLSNNCNDYTDSALDFYLGYNWCREIISDGVDLILQWDERFPPSPLPRPPGGRK